MKTRLNEHRSSDRRDFMERHVDCRFSEVAMMAPGVRFEPSSNGDISRFTLPQNPLFSS